MKTTIHKRIGQLGVCFVAFLLSISPLWAAEHTEIRTLTIYSDVAGASEILAKDYDSAIELILTASKYGETRIQLASNLCVAYTLAGEFALAKAACDAAIREASLRRNYGGDWFKRYMSAEKKRSYKTHAYTNRSILRERSGNTDGSAQDLKRAMALNR